jgi:hypothetical protein
MDYGLWIRGLAIDHTLHPQLANQYMATRHVYVRYCFQRLGLHIHAILVTTSTTRTCGILNFAARLEATGTVPSPKHEHAKDGRQKTRRM